MQLEYCKSILEWYNNFQILKFDSGIKKESNSKEQVKRRMIDQILTWIELKPETWKDTEP